MCVRPVGPPKAARVQRVRPAFGGLVQRVQRVQKVQRVVASPGGDEYEYSVTFSFPPYSSFCAANKESWYLP